MKTCKIISTLIVAHALCFVATAQAGVTIFNQNFDGGYTGAFGIAGYYGGAPTNYGNMVVSSGGNPNGAWTETMTATTWSDYYAGQVQLMTVSGNTDTNPSDYVLSFDAYGSQAANIQLGLQCWQGNYFGGAQIINATLNDQLSAANTWQTFSVNLGTISGAIPTGATWQFNFQLNSWQWGGPGNTNTLTIDNIVLTEQPPAPTALPVYRVVQSGATWSQATNLAGQLSIPTASLAYTNGAVSFIDPTNWLYVPTVAVTDPTLISNLLAVTKNPYPAIPIKFQAIDFGALTNQSPPGTNFVLTNATMALATAGLTPQFGTPVPASTMFTAFCTNTDGSVASVHVPLDTQVNYQFADSNGIPIIGSGALARVTYGLNGRVTHLVYTACQLAPGPQVQLISSNTAISRIANLVPADAQITAQLVYWVDHRWPGPPLPWDRPDPTNVIPWYSFIVRSSATNPVTGSNYTTTLTVPNIPATDDPNYVPSAMLAASGTTQVVATVSVSGGTPPYVYSWSGSNPDVVTNTGPSVTYTPTVLVEAPLLSIALLSNAVYISWPASQVFILASTLSVAAPAWSQVAYAVTTNEDGLCEVTVPATSNSQFFCLLPADPAPMTETVSVTVRDAYSVRVTAVQTLTVQPTPVRPPVAHSVGPLTWATHSPYDVTGFDYDRSSWEDIMSYSDCSAGTRRFSMTQYSSTPGQFMEPTPQGAFQTLVPARNGAPSLDISADSREGGVNTANMVFYLGHGNASALSFTWPNWLPMDGLQAYPLQLRRPGVDMTATYKLEWSRGPYTFLSTNSYPMNLTHAWGNIGPNDCLNWLGLSACEVLMYNVNNSDDFSMPNATGVYAWQRWGGAFNGLHMMFGYHNDALVGCGTPGRCASIMLRCYGASGTPPEYDWPLTIVQSWMHASASTQPSSVVPAAMGPLGPGGVLDSWDYYPGKGPMGPSIPPDQITGWWYMKHDADHVLIVPR